MRLVSQDGKFDVPYEIAALSRTGNIIRAYVPIVGEKGTVMAHYSTDGKAMQVMEMLHDAYHDAKKSNSSSTLYFPKDDEV
mgnify:FL=1|jgi:hypothetical protein